MSNAWVTFNAGPDDAGRRLDVVLGAHPEVESRAEAQRLIAAGLVRIGEVPVTKRQKIAEGDLITFQPLDRPQSGLVAEDVALTIRYEDEHLFVVDKPAGVVTHPGRGHASGTLVHGLLGRGAGGGEQPDRPGIVHRLDRDTSGLLVVSRDDRTHRRLQAALKERAIDRRYLVLVHGAFPPALTVDRPIGRDRRNRTKMSLNTDTPREARTNFRRLADHGDLSLLEARLDTGRTHQIRVHLESVNFPVVGDPLYSRRPNPFGLSRQFLHAYRIAFTHPITDEEITVESPLPPDLQAVLDALGDNPRAAR